MLTPNSDTPAATSQPAPAAQLPVDPKLMERILATTYLGGEMPYHNRSHAAEVARAAMQIAKSAQEHGISVETQTLVLAALLHDSLSHIDATALGFSSAEELSARYAYTFLVQNGFGEAVARKAAEAIQATNPYYTPSSVEAKILRAADLLNVAGPWEEFRANTARLAQEAEFRTGKSAEFTQHVTGCINYLSLYLWRALDITPASRDAAGRSVYHLNAARNLFRLADEVFPGEGMRRVAVLCSGKTPPAFPAEYGEHADVRPQFMVTLADHESDREALIRSARATTRFPALALVIPGRAGALSIPQASVDEVRAPALAPELLAEAARVLKPDGVLRIPAPGSLEQSADLAGSSAFGFELADSSKGFLTLRSRRA
ncbi:MAG: hypothetical protein EBZ48_00385 [Proteobacteria bacterium]|nr:hypothetical protein [Pseudomonadota bacterium]